MEDHGEITKHGHVSLHFHPQVRKERIYHFYFFSQILVSLDISQCDCAVNRALGVLYFSPHVTYIK
jgi:hypothetical protein